MSDYAEQMADAHRMSDALYNEAARVLVHGGDIDRALVLAYESGKAMACANVLESPHDVLIHVGFMLAEARDAINEMSEEN